MKILTSFRKKFPHGNFILHRGESIKWAVKHYIVPEKFGVYIISIGNLSEEEIIYIGKSGTLKKDGSFKKQHLRKRLTMKQKKVYREIFFERFMEENSLNELHFEWFVTYGERIDEPLLPFLAEAQLLSEYFYEYGVLPTLNEAA